MNDLAPDDLLNMIKSRRTVRKFDPGKSVNDKSLTRILQAGTWAPYSPYYPQRWKFLALKGVLRDQAVGIVSSAKHDAAGTCGRIGYRCGYLSFSVC